MQMSSAKARALLADTTLMEVLDKIEARAIETILNAPLDEDEGRKSAAIKANAIRDIRRELTNIANESDNPVPRRA